MYGSRTEALGSIRLSGILLLEKGWPVVGSTSCTGLLEKSPDLIALVGTVAY
jgi:hypothetical protein